MSADGRVSSPHDLVPRDAPKNCHSWLVTNPRKSFDQANDKRALYYRAARHVLERHNSGARPNPIIGLGATSARWDSYFVAPLNTARETMFEWRPSLQT